MEKINIAELLKDCPEGMELDCTMYDDLVFVDVDLEAKDYPITTRLKNGTQRFFTSDGRYELTNDAKCVIFPKGKTTWDGFVPPREFKDGDVLVHTREQGFIMSIYHERITEFRIKTHCILWDKDKGLSVDLIICCRLDKVRLATEEEKQKLFDAIKDNGYKWNTETKTLEKLIEPKFKVGDKVTHNMEILMNIVHMFWDAECNVIRYDIQSPVDNNYKLKAMLAEHLQPYKEETMKEKDEKSANHVFDTEIISFDIAKRDKYELDLQGKFDVKLREGKYYVERIKPQYPKTYKECCEVLGLNTMDNDAQGYKGDLIIRFQELLIARDAYWKIAGEKMGLGEPWKPDWNSANSKKSILYTCGNIIHTGISLINNYILAFPTEEMRDAFYENFKELIEGCKELLW